MRTGNNIRLRKDGRYEARYIKARNDEGKIIYGYCYGQTYEEAEIKRNNCVQMIKRPRELNLLILGSGSHGLEVMELARDLRLFKRIDFLDDFETGPRIIGKCENLGQYLNEYPVAFPAVGDTRIRIRWMKELIKEGFLIPTLIHPTAVVSQNATIDTGSVICARATVGTGAAIGKGCIISSGAIIDRNIVLPDWSYVECGESVNYNSIKKTVKDSISG